MKQQITLQNHQFTSVQSTIPPLLHKARKLIFYCFFLMCLTTKIVYHCQHRRPPLLKFYKIIATFNNITMAIPGRVTGNICFGSTKIHSSSTGVVFWSETPELFTNIPITHSTVCTWDLIEEDLCPHIISFVEISSIDKLNISSNAILIVTTDTYSALETLIIVVIFVCVFCFVVIPRDYYMQQRKKLRRRSEVPQNKEVFVSLTEEGSTVQVSTKLSSSSTHSTRHV